MKRKYKNIRQHDASDCGAAVISTILLTYKKELSIMKIREIIGTDAYGTSLKGVYEGLQKLKFDVQAIRVDVTQITHKMTFPAIVQVLTKEGMNHFVVLHGVTKKHSFIIGDPSQGVYEQSEEDFATWYRGVLLVCAPTSEFEQSTLTDLSMFSVFKQLMIPQKSLIFLTVFSSCVLSIIGILSSLFSKVLMDEIIPYQLKNSLYIFLIVFACTTLIQNLLSAFRQHVLLYLSRKIDLPLLLGYYNHIIHLPYFFFVSRKVGDILTRFQDAMTMKEIFTSVSISLVMDVLLSLISAVVLWQMKQELFLILVLIVLFNIGLIYLFKKPYKRINYDQMEATSFLNSQLIESIKNIETVKSAANESEQIKKLEERYVNALKLSYKEGKLKNIQSVIANCVGAIGNLIFMGVGALFIIDQKMTIGDLLVFQTLSQYFTEPIQNLVSLQLAFQEAQIAMKRLGEVMTLEREDFNNTLSIQPKQIENIAFENVTFAYGSRKPILKEMSFKITKGEKVAFVGESGAGKSTIVRLLLKFMEVQQGKILIGNTNLSDVNTTEIRKKIGYIPQNIEMFTGTVLENLTIRNNKKNMDQIVQICRLVGIDQYIEQLPNRYLSYIEEGGANLSGGEKQRLAIARTLLGYPEVLVFDESTSHLDSYSEQRIQQLIFNDLSEKTVIMIAHRITTVTKCDVIYYVDEGAIVESGSHDELMKKDGKYAAMFRLQVNDGVTSNSSQQVTTNNQEEMRYG